MIVFLCRLVWIPSHICARSKTLRNQFQWYVTSPFTMHVLSSTTFCHHHSEHLDHFLLMASNNFMAALYLYGSDIVNYDLNNVTCVMHNMQNMHNRLKTITFTWWNGPTKIVQNMTTIWPLHYNKCLLLKLLLHILHPMEKIFLAMFNWSLIKTFLSSPDVCQKKKQK